MGMRRREGEGQGGEAERGGEYVRGRRGDRDREPTRLEGKSERWVIEKKKEGE